MMIRPDSIPKNIDSALKSFAGEGGLSIQINGTCMEPLIKNGALVSVHKQTFYWPGDILVKRCSSGPLVAHRLIGIYLREKGLNFITRADDAEKADPAVPSSCIIGRVSGGECANPVVSVPVRSRIKAIGQFITLGVNRLGHRLSSK